MGVHKAEVHIRKSEYDRVNKLLAIESFEDMSDEELFNAGASTDQYEDVYIVRFDDGSSLNYDLCSGASNYYDGVIWTSADGSRDVILNCEFKLGDIEFQVDDETYMVIVIK